MITPQDIIPVAIDGEAFAQAPQVANLQAVGVEVKGRARNLARRSASSGYEAKTPVGLLFGLENHRRIPAFPSLS